MQRRFIHGSLVVLLLAALAGGPVAADEALSEPNPLPATRPELKQALEALKFREPRLPLDDVEGRSVYNGRARAQYLPRAWYAADFRSDPAMTLDDTFKVRLFWIVSRGNNCHY